jgi:hypothetical protein
VPNQRPGRISDLVGRLLRHLTPVVRICLLVGMAMGFFLGLYLALGVPPDEAENIAITHPPPRIGFAIISGLTLAGAVLGSGAGVVVERAFSDKGDPGKKKPWWRAGKSTRHRR